MPLLNRRLGAALAGTAVAATAVLAGAPVASAAPPYKVVILELHCFDKEELIDADYAKLKTGANTIWGPKKMVKDQSRGVNKSYAFDSRTVIKLYENDDWLDEDDYLGTVTASASDVGKGELTGVFDRNGALYELTYKVIRNQ